MMQRSAELSEDGKYRYRLGRIWEPAKKLALFIMLNPSTADSNIDDPTIRRCLSFAGRWGYGGVLVGVLAESWWGLSGVLVGSWWDLSGVLVGNLFALRSSSPSVLYQTELPEGGEANDLAIRSMVDESALSVAAWGNHGSFRNRANSVLPMLNGRGWALGLTQQGQPKRPLYVRGTADLIQYEQEG